MYNNIVSFPMVLRKKLVIHGPPMINTLLKKLVIIVSLPVITALQKIQLSVVMLFVVINQIYIGIVMM